ncbi:MAG: hypothetical protein KKD76_04580 [Verrucomicrobia bacterium]|nr:hypothetical protein [Verrucomicrobiota bacterium]
MRSYGFEVNPYEYIRQHDLIFAEESQTWESGLAIGNGDLGALHYVPRSPLQVEWLINKTDIWDVRHQFNLDPKPYDTHEDVMLAVQKNRKVNFGQFDKPCFPFRSTNTPKSAAKLRIGPWGLASAENTSYLVYLSEFIEEINQRLRISHGVAETDIFIENQKPKIHIESCVHADKNLLIIDVKNPPAYPIELYRWTDNTFGYPPETFAEGDYFGLEYKFPEVPTVRTQAYPELHHNFSYVVMARIVGMKYRTFSYLNRAIADFDFPTRMGYPFPGPVNNYTIYVAVVTKMDAANPRQEARRLLDQSIAAGRQNLQKSHDRWWQGFWNRSFVDIPDKNLENLWYFGLYQLACCSRGKLLPGISGLWFGPDLFPGHYDGVFCQGAYTQDQNTTDPHYWTLATNHPELLANYLDTFTRLMPMAKCLTREMFAINGMHMPLTNTPLGIETTPFYGRYNFISSPLTAMLFWMHYDFVKDRETLESTIYPFLKESCEFFLNFMKKGEDGKYVLYPTYPSEQSRELGFEKNPTGTLMMLKALLIKTREACHVLEKNPELVNRITEMLDHFPDYPVGQGCFLQSEDEPDPKYYGQLSRIEAGFPNGEIDADKPGRERSMLINTLKAFKKDKYWAAGSAAFLILPMGGTLAYLKWPDEVMKHLYGFAIAHCLKPNGMIAVDAIHGRNIVKRHEVSPSAIEGIGSVGNTITEMLLQSYHEVIQVFPCIPVSWKKAGARFSGLRARGAFLVESSISGKKVDYISVISEQGGVCRIRNPWKRSETIRVLRHDRQGRLHGHAFEICDGLIVFSTSAGTQNLVQPESSGSSARKRLVIKAPPAKTPRIIRCPDGTRVSIGRVKSRTI